MKIFIVFLLIFSGLFICSMDTNKVCTKHSAARYHWALPASSGSITTLDSCEKEHQISSKSDAYEEKSASSHQGVKNFIRMVDREELTPESNSCDSFDNLDHRIEHRTLPREKYTQADLEMYGMCTLKKAQHQAYYKEQENKITSVSGKPSQTLPYYKPL